MVSSSTATAWLNHPAGTKMELHNAVICATALKKLYLAGNLIRDLPSQLVGSEPA